MSITTPSSTAPTTERRIQPLWPLLGLVSIGFHLSLIFSGLSRLGGANALEMALTGTILIVIIALVFDGLLVLLGRLTISKGLQ